MIDTTKIVLASWIATDKLLGSYTGSFTATDPGVGGQTTTSVTLPTNIPETTFIVGVFSVDGGTTWQGMETDVNHSDGFGDISVYATSQANTAQIIAVNERDMSAPTGTWSIPVQYKVMLIAKPDQGNVTPQPIGSNVYFDSRKNYQKIASDTSQTFTGTDQTLTFSHGLGYVPRIRVFYEEGGVLRLRGGITTSQTTLDTSNIYVLMGGSHTSCKVYARIYYSA